MLIIVPEKALGACACACVLCASVRVCVLGIGMLIKGWGRERWYWSCGMEVVSTLTLMDTRRDERFPTDPRRATPCGLVFGLGGSDLRRKDVCPGCGVCGEGLAGSIMSGSWVASLLDAVV